ncbi:MAG TPA: cobalamin B12-binding domain-containing protein [Gaiellaceae bacterium]|nr:cobalamin B12-binding domain-containing protein [Gaiellaceae bacterium]
MYRIGELARRTGVSPDLLRAWERRYGLLEPVRTGGGFRVYSEADEQRVRAMQSHLEQGLAAAEAARLARAGEAAPPAEALRAALLDFDELGAQRALDVLLAAFSSETVVVDVVLPLLREIGEGWQEGSVSVAQEHFASQLLRGRLLGLARGWGVGSGPLALLACPPGERHDIGLIAFGLALRGRGWRIVFLGADTPLDTIAAEADRLGARLVVLALMAEPTGGRAQLTALARRVPLALGGTGATEALARMVGAEQLDDDPVAAADAVGSSA